MIIYPKSKLVFINPWFYTQRDDIGIGGSWSEFLEYLVNSIKFGDVKLVLEGKSKSDGNYELLISWILTFLLFNFILSCFLYSFYIVILWKSMKLICSYKILKLCSIDISPSPVHAKHSTTYLVFLSLFDDEGIHVFLHKDTILVIVPV